MKKINLAIASIFAIACVTLSSCHIGCIHGSGNASTETRKTGNFGQIDIEGAFAVILKQDSSRQITVTADDNLQKYIHTVVDGNKLRVYSRKNLCNKAPMLIEIGIANINLLKSSGANTIENKGPLHVQDLKLDLSGANKITLALNAANLVTDGSGSTEIHLSGQATSHKLELTGSGKVYAFDFVTGDYDINTTGAADVEINVLRSLKTNTTGAADIKYKGSPEIIKNEKAGAASIKKVD